MPEQSAACAAARCLTPTMPVTKIESRVEGFIVVCGASLSAMFKNAEAGAVDDVGLDHGKASTLPPSVPAPYSRRAAGVISTFLAARARRLVDAAG